MAEKYEFLSPEWDVAAEAITGTSIQAPDGFEFTMNVTISPTPYGDKNISVVAHEGKVSFDKTHVEQQDLLVTTDYETAYSLFLQGDFTVVLSKMLEGKVVVNGDIAKLLSLATAAGPLPSLPFLDDLSAQLREITITQQHQN